MTHAPAPLHGELVVVPPDLHAGQLEVLHDPSRFKLLRAGRRWRKSGLGVVQAFTGYEGPEGREYRGALTGGQIGWWVPSLTARYLVADWEPIKGLARQIPGHRIEEANHRVIMPSGGSIMMLTGDNDDSGRGLGLDGAVVDEASLISETLWHQTIQATLMDKLGWGLLLFTPKGMNWIHGLTEEAAVRPGWRAFHFRSQDNPFLTAEGLAELTRGLSTLAYRQEVEAEFVSGGAGLFDRSWFRYWSREQNELGDTVGYHLENPGQGTSELISSSRCWRFATVDLAWSLEEHADYTVIQTWAVTPSSDLVLLDQSRGRFEGPAIARAVREAYELHRPGFVLVERTNRQLGIVRDLERSGMPIREVRADKSKEARALPATARMEGGHVWFPRGAPWVKDLEIELLSFPMGRHDDQVDALCYAVAEGARKKTRLIGGVTV